MAALDIAMAEAKRYGFNAVTHLGNLDGSDVFVAGFAGCDEPPCVGLPHVLLVKDGKVEAVTAYPEVFEILSAFPDNEDEEETDI